MRLLSRLLLLTASLAFSFGLAEIALRIWLPQPVDYFYFEASPRANARFSRWNIEISTNSFGFRDNEHEEKKQPGVKRIAVLGDSITYGTGVEFANIYHQKLAAILAQGGGNRPVTEVIALNQGASSTRWALETYIQKARRFSPDLVVLGFCMNDFENYDAPAPPLKSTQIKFYDSLADFHSRLRINSHLYFLVFERARRLLYQHVIDRTIRTQDSWIPMTPLSDAHKETFNTQLNSTAAMIERFHREVQRDGAHFLVVLFPFEMQVTDDLNKLYANEYGVSGLEAALQGQAQSLLIERLKDRGIQTLDLLPTFRGELEKNPSEQLYFRELGGMLDWAHPNARGHELAAQAIASKVREMKW